MQSDRACDRGVVCKNQIVSQDLKTKVLFIGPTPPPYSGPEMGMQLFLASSLRDSFDIRHIRTNVRRSNKNKGRLDLTIITAFFRFFGVLLWTLAHFRPVVAYYPITATQTGWLGRDSWCLLACRLFRVKTVVHMRGSHFRLNYEQFSAPARKLTRHCLGGVDLALVQAEYLRSQFFGLVDDDKIKFLRNAIDTREYNNLDLTKYGALNVLFLGHLTKAKGYCDLARAIPLVAKKHPDVRFHFAGTLRKGERNVFFDQSSGKPIEYEDPYELHEQLLKSDNSSNYVYHGVVSGEEKRELIRDAAIFVSPSYSEGFSRALLEAMSMGKAIVCTPVGAHKEQVHDTRNALIVAPGDVVGLAEAICKLLNSPKLRHSMARENYEYTRASFDSVPVAAQLGEFLSAVVKKTNRSK